MQHTTNYNLSQYDATDRVTRSTFNSDNLAIDAALKRVSDAAGAAQSTANSASSAAAAAQSAANAAAAAAAAGAKIVTGTYTGTGTYGEANPRSLTFGFAPKLVIIAPDTGNFSNYPCQFGLFFQGQVYAHTWPIGSGGGADSYVAKLTWSGSSVSWYAKNIAAQLNTNGLTYHYIAFG